MPWIESHQELERHPKTLDLMFTTGWDLDQTLGKLHRFWWWALAFCEDGNLSRYKPSQYMPLLDHKFDPEDLYKRFVDCKFIDSDGKIHDWLDYAGRYLSGKYKTSNPKILKQIGKLYKSDLSPSKVSLKTDNLTLPNHTLPNQPKDMRLLKFEDFWKAYPARNGKKLLKKSALKEFLKLREEEIPELMIAVANYAGSGQYPKDPPRFFKGAYWREWLTPARTAEKLSVKTETPDRTTQRRDYPPDVQDLVKSAIPKVNS